MSYSVFSPSPVAQSMEVPLSSRPTAVRLARTLTREWYRHWRAPEHVITSAELIVSELVTNVVTTSKSDVLRLRIRWGGQSGYIEVWDADPNPPVPREAEETDTGGRGLFLMSACAVRWNYYPAEGGKVVRAELSASHVPAR